MKTIALLVCLAIPAKPITLTQAAAATTIAINVIELPATLRKGKAALKKFHWHRKPKPVPAVAIPEVKP